VLDWRVVRRRLLYAVAIVSGLGLAAEVSGREALVSKLSLSYESNLPTWFSSSLLLACAVAAGVIAHTSSQLRKQWWFISGLAGWMSLDEAAELHENLGGHLPGSGILYFDWVIPATAIVALLVATFVPFIRALHPPTRTRLIIAGLVYVGGALVMELPLGWWTENHGMDGLGYALIDWVEETLEMIGAALACGALIAEATRTSR
jgi:hypothetical protein